MKSRPSVFLAAAFVAPALLLSACGDDSGEKSAAAPTPSGTTAGKQVGPDTYIPVISKGFQHQFWQAVKQGAEESAKKNNVKISFEGPENETQVDKQVEMLQAALDKKETAAICFAALDSKAAVPLLQQAKSKNIPVIGFDSGVDSDIPVATAATDNIKAAGEACGQDGRADRELGRGRRRRPRPDQPYGHRPA
jgi:ribose transport system substrate-binding protein